MSKRPFMLCAAMVLGAMVLGSCVEEESVLGDPTGSTCPPDSTLTYETFGKSFAELYCLDCHSETVSGDERNGAPSDHNFDTLDLMLDVGAEHLDRTAASGPNSENDGMPPRTDDGPKPTDAERRLLGEWLACGMP